METLTETSFWLYAAKHYRSEFLASMDEFCDDIRRFKYVRKLITRYTNSGELNERLILNHLIVLNNVFDPTALVRMLTLKMEFQLPQLKPFLVYMSIWPEKIINVKEERVIDGDNIAMDQNIVNALRAI